jgi:hypothetical protein
VAQTVTLDDGIFFNGYREGVPGMQPERLGPYITTLNPGYDPALPLYRPWPMFEAIRDANTRVTNSPWATLPNVKKASQPAAPVKTGATLAYVQENGGQLAQQLAKAGIRATVYSASEKADFLLVDGSVEPSDSVRDSLRTAMTKVLGDGGTVWVWNITKAGAPAISKLLAKEVIAEPRVATSFIGKPSPMLAGLVNAGLYFSEGDDWRQSAYSLSGDFVKDAQVVLEACPADWRRWNYKSEPVKTASILRSQLEHPGSLDIIVTTPLDKGQAILCNLSPDSSSTRKISVLKQLFANEGIQPEAVVAQDGFIDQSGKLVQALVCGSFGVTEAKAAYSVRAPVDGVKQGTAFDGHKWALARSDNAGVFDFKSGITDGPQATAYAYVAVWIKSSKPLNDLLSEPNLPKLTFTYGSDDGCEVWLNGELLSTHERLGPLEPEMFSENPLLLKLGWNLLVIKVVQDEGEWKFAGKFACTDANFLQKLEFAAERQASQ